MKRVKSLKWAFLVSIILPAALIGASNISATDMVSHFDNRLASGSYTIYTDTVINSDESLANMLYDGVQEYWNSSDDWSSLSLSPVGCSYSNMTCNFDLYRNSANQSEKIKSYENIAITIDSEISADFPMVSGNTIAIDYPESMFESSDEKYDYIRNYINSFSEYNGSTSVYYSCRWGDSDQVCGVIERQESNNNVMVKRSTKVVDEIVFNYSEGPYSDNFKKLTSGTLEIKTDKSGDIDSNTLGSYLTNIYGQYYFNIDGGVIKNNKAIIKMATWSDDSEVVLEKHLVTLVKNTNIDVSLFDRIGYATSVNIPADEPSDAPQEYLSHYFNMLGHNFNTDDGVHEYYNESIDYSNYSGKAVITYSKHNKQDDLLDFQIHEVPVVFAGYSTTTSSEYSEKIGNKIIVRADYLDIDSINNSLRNINGDARALRCNGDYSVCDIAYLDFKNNTVEIHKINIELDNTVSDAFKKAFKIKDDGSVDVVIGDGAILSAWGVSAYFYNESTHDSLHFECNGGSCELYLDNYAKKLSEVHEVAYNVIKTNPSSNYASLVKDSIDVYPGENKRFWDSVSSYNLFTKKAYNNISVNTCDSSKKKCSVVILNSDGKLEIHNSNVVVKDGESPQFSSLFPSDTVAINAIEKDDADFIDSASMAYFFSETKTFTYLNGYKDGTAKIVYKGLETHTKNISFAKGNENHKKVVDNIIAKLNKEKLNFMIDDMEYVNYFYYRDSDTPVLEANNYNSKTVKDILSKKIGNKHVSYFFVDRCGIGDIFMEESGGNILLYYDGIAYGQTDDIALKSMNHVIYVPDNTPNTTDAFVKAAQKRIDSYLGKNSGVVVSFKEKWEEDVAPYFNEAFDLTGFDGNRYHIVYKDREEDILILKNSKKMQNATFFASDVNNNVDVSSDNANYPTNTVVSAETIDKTTKKYKDLLKKLGLSVAQVVDISLYSPSIGDINNFNGVSFSVNVPIQTSLFGSGNLYAYFVSDDGKIEEHPIAMDDFMGMFGTNHFSTYVIAEKVDNKVIEEANNPSTYDDVKMWIVTGSLCSIGLAGTLVYIKAKVLRKTR